MGFAMPVIGVMVGVTVVTAAAVGALMLLTTFVKPVATAVTHVSAAAEDSSAAFKLTTLTVRRRRRFLTPFPPSGFPRPNTSGGAVGFAGMGFRELEASNVVWRSRWVLCTVNPLGRAAA